MNKFCKPIFLGFFWVFVLPVTDVAVDVQKAIAFPAERGSAVEGKVFFTGGVFANGEVYHGIGVDWVNRVCFFAKSSHFIFKQHIQPATQSGQTHLNEIIENFE